MYANPFSQPELFDIVIVAGVASPGVAKVTAGKRIYVVEKKNGPGTAGANITFRGRDVVEFSIDFSFWRADQLDDWATWSELFKWDPVKQKTITPVDILHPLLDELSVYQCVAKTVGQLEHQGGGRWTAKIECVEWRPVPAKNVTSSPSSTKSSTNPTPGGGAPPPTAEDILKELEKSANTRAQNPN